MKKSQPKVLTQPSQIIPQKPKSKSYVSTKYESNRHSLQQLPRTIAIVISIGMILFIVWLFLPSNQNNTPRLASELVVSDTLPNQSNTTILETVLGDKEYIIRNTDGNMCLLSRVNNPLSVNEFELLSSYTPIFIDTENSQYYECNSDLVRLDLYSIPPAWQNKISSNSNGSKVVPLSGNRNIYAFISSKSKNINVDAVTLEPLLAMNTKSVVTPSPFDTTKALSQKQIKNKTYYLDNGCKSPRTTKCSLWEQDMFSGETRLLKTDIALSGTDQLYQIKGNARLVFSRTQDLEDTLTLLYYSDAPTTITLIRISTTSSEYPIINSVELTPGEPNYTLYV